MDKTHCLFFQYNDYMVFKLKSYYGGKQICYSHILDENIYSPKYYYAKTIFLQFLIKEEDSNLQFDIESISPNVHSASTDGNVYHVDEF